MEWSSASALQSPKKEYYIFFPSFKIIASCAGFADSEAEGDGLEEEVQKTLEHVQKTLKVLEQPRLAPQPAAVGDEPTRRQDSTTDDLLIDVD